MSANFLLLILLGVGRSMAGRRLLPTGDTELTETITSSLDQIDTAEKGAFEGRRTSSAGSHGWPCNQPRQDSAFPAKSRLGQ